jgi:hypothetical protein
MQSVPHVTVEGFRNQPMNGILALMPVDAQPDPNIAIRVLVRLEPTTQAKRVNLSVDRDRIKAKISHRGTYRCHSGAIAASAARAVTETSRPAFGGNEAEATPDGGAPFKRIPI